MRPRIIIICVFILTALAVAACGEDEEAPAVATEDPETPTASPRATRTKTPEATEAAQTGDIEGFRTFAEEIEEAVQAGDADFFLEQPFISTLTCPSEVEPRCEGQPDGTDIEGMWLAYWGSEGSLITEESMREEVTNYLGSLTSPELYALASDSRETEGSEITGPPPVYYAVVTGEGDPAERTRIFQFRFVDGEWQMSVLIVGGLLGDEDWKSDACDGCYDYWERWEGS